nr:uncharacterized protein LOC117282000 isoform X1 [Nicotiana tomentosiformis]
MIDLQDVIIVTPSLHSLKLLNTKKVPSSSPVVGSRLTEAEIGLKYVYATNRLPDLRTFAENLGEKMTLSLVTNTTESKEVRVHFGDPRSIIQPLGIKHINLEILFSWLPRYESFIDELFSYFHPKTLLVRVNSDSSKNNFIQVFCKVTTSSAQYFLIFTTLSPLFSHCMYICYESVGPIGYCNYD